MMWQAALAVCLISLAVVVYLIVTAPEGYEDETGFHYGKPTDNLKEQNEKDTTSSGTGTV